MFNFKRKTIVKDRDLAFIDIEMTGLELDHEVIEVAVVRVSGYNFSVIDEWETKIKPRHIEKADPEALKLNGYNEKGWKDAMDLESAMKIFLEKTDEAVLVGHGLPIDWYHIYKSLAEFKLKPTFYYKGLDTFGLAWQKLRNLPDAKFKSFSLGELSKYFNIEPEKPHSALDDAKTTYKVFLCLTK